MFARVKKSGKHQYLQIVENRKVKGKVIQRVIDTLAGCQLQEKDRIQTVIRSLSRFSEKVLLVLSGKSDVSTHSKKIGYSGSDQAILSIFKQYRPKNSCFEGLKGHF